MVIHAAGSHYSNNIKKLCSSKIYYFSPAVKANTISVIFSQLITHYFSGLFTLDDSHHTGTTEIVQQLKVVPHHLEAYLLTMFFINTLFGPIFSFLCCLQCSFQHF